MPFCSTLLETLNQHNWSTPKETYYIAAPEPQSSAVSAFVSDTVDTRSLTTTHESGVGNGQVDPAGFGPGYGQLNPSEFASSGTGNDG